ncbi:Oidioi.mRNA.OKI2018_I69.XSR.g13580.t1.cds [Oikopleura dioica]|uniref:Oidioi.mRNA.OKI2018_I69.XSR.g13580.t1.cds n=1 Tax=Oikopleura dioica TaxID=34765 RepID=A0ABN7S7B0_OIKDI|nr:Oidioi.mRNA.OKI2018_I69.XSR.g13580.t1.cds [Oikopleura dioica]
MQANKTTKIDEFVKNQISLYATTKYPRPSLSQTASWASKEFRVKLSNADVLKIVKKHKAALNSPRIINRKNASPHLIAFHKDLEKRSATMLDKEDVIGLAERLRHSRKYRNIRVVQMLEFTRQWWRDFQAEANVGRPEFSIKKKEIIPPSREDMIKKIFEELARDPFKYLRC